MNNSTWTDREGVPAGHVRGQPTREWAMNRPITPTTTQMLIDLRARLQDRIDLDVWAPALSARLDALDILLAGT